MNSAFLIFDGFSNFVLASAIEPLRVARSASMGESFSWQLLSLDGQDVHSSSGLTLRCDGSLSDISHVDILFVISGYDVREQAHAHTLRRIQQTARHVDIMAGLDSGAWLLAASGLLNGYCATIHWQNMTHFTETWLDVEVKNERYVIDGNRISAGDAMAVLELMLHLIAERAGKAVAFEVHTMFSRDSGHIHINKNNGMISTSSPSDPHALRAVHLMRRHIEQPLRLEAIAKGAALTPRSLSRLFWREFGISPGQFYEGLRLETARSLARETRLPVSEIATRTGYTSSSCLSRAYHRHFGQTLRDLRRQFMI